MTYRSPAPTLLLAIFLSGCSPHINLNAPLNSRPPNQHELFYTAVASNLRDFHWCERISGRALQQDGPDMGSPDWCVARQKSICYFYVAVQTNNAQLCDSVQQVKTMPSNKSPISPVDCRKIIEKKNGSSYLLMPDFHAVPGLMTEMGYRVEDVRSAKQHMLSDEPLTGDAVKDWGFFYGYLLRQAPAEQKQDFLKRLQSLPSFRD